MPRSNVPMGRPFGERQNESTRYIFQSTFAHVTAGLFAASTISGARLPSRNNWARVATVRVHIS
eukprot:1705354-Pyramimonas_sp.AAC.1